MGKKTWFPAIHGGSKFSSTMSGIFSALSGGAVAKAWKRAQGKGVEGNLKGEGTVLGGMCRGAACVPSFLLFVWSIRRADPLVFFLSTIQACGSFTPSRGFCTNLGKKAGATMLWKATRKV